MADVLIMMDSSVCHAGERWELIRKWSHGLANQLKNRLHIADTVQFASYGFYIEKIKSLYLGAYVFGHEKFGLFFKHLSFAIKLSRNLRNI